MKYKLYRYKNDHPFKFIEFYKYFTTVIAFLVINFIIFKILIGLANNYIIVEPFEVPTQLSNSGYTGKTIATKIINRMEYLTSKSVFRNNNEIINASSSVYKSDIIIPYASNTLTSIVMSIREVISDPLFIISGFIVSDNKNDLKMKYIMKGKRRLILTNDNDYVINKDNDLDEIINNAALKILVQIDPSTVAGYYFRVEDYKSVIAICNAINKMEPRYAGITYSIWANAHLKLSEFDKALNKIEEAAKYINSKDLKTNVYAVWGDILRKKCAFSEAIVKYKVVSDNNSKDSYPYYMIGDILILQKKYNESITYLNRAIDLDKDNPKKKDTIFAISNVINTLRKVSDDELDKINSNLNMIIISQDIY
ncbi:MAG: tetratricopeptide repeat protein [Desulfuromonadaceae bacterium]|nr:tetratricopeptide repeat protein [Desulfuromonadaceae bacterium]